MNELEFKEIISDFDGFMRKHGYYTIKEAADYEGIAEVSIRQRIQRGTLTGQVKIANKTYIPLNYYKSKEVIM